MTAARGWRTGWRWTTRPRWTGSAPGHHPDARAFRAHRHGLRHGLLPLVLPGAAARQARTHDPARHRGLVRPAHLARAEGQVASSTRRPGPTTWPRCASPAPSPPSARTTAPPPRSTWSTTAPAAPPATACRRRCWRCGAARAPSPAGTTRWRSGGSMPPADGQRPRGEQRPLPGRGGAGGGAGGARPLPLTRLGRRYSPQAPLLFFWVGIRRAAGAGSPTANQPAGRRAGPHPMPSAARSMIQGRSVAAGRTPAWVIRSCAWPR